MVLVKYTCCAGPPVLFPQTAGWRCGSSLPFGEKSKCSSSYLDSYWGLLMHWKGLFPDITPFPDPPTDHLLPPIRASSAAIKTCHMLSRNAEGGRACLEPKGRRCGVRAWAEGGEKGAAGGGEEGVVWPGNHAQVICLPIYTLLSLQQLDSLSLTQHSDTLLI